MKNNNQKVQLSAYEKKENQAPQSKKREREREGHSNETPPPKRPQKGSAEQKKFRQSKPKRKFLYAEIAKEASEITIVRKNGDHISLFEWSKVIKILDTYYIRIISTTESSTKPLSDNEGCRYTNKRAAMHVGDYVRNNKSEGLS
uniref:Uncharacterized protein n=1 Tax=Lepeophtheirus salmonis TaxID=72036 RepID=A0A0K2VB40_LEPSM